MLRFLPSSALEPVPCGPLALRPMPAVLPSPRCGRRQAFRAATRLQIERLPQPRVPSERRRAHMSTCRASVLWPIR
eukprot:3314166-Alexandrium_andersonii.AAC.1